MAKVKLGIQEFDVDSEEINASGCGVPAADLALFAARVKSGEIRRVKKLYLVMLFLLIFLMCVSAFGVLPAAAPALTCAVQWSNQIGDDGAKSIAAAVEGNTSLQILDIVR